MVNREVAHFIRACAHFRLVNLCSHEVEHLLQTIESYTPFYLVFLDFGEPGGIPDHDGYIKTLTFIDCMTGFGLGLSTGIKNIISYQAARWDFGNFFVLFGLPKMIVVDVDGLFTEMFKKTFQWKI